MSRLNSNPAIKKIYCQYKSVKIEIKKKNNNKIKIISISHRTVFALLLKYISFVKKLNTNMK